MGGLNIKINSKIDIDETHPHIRICSLKTGENKLEAKFEYSEDLKKYFLSENFYAEYDVELNNIPESILLIPPLATIITIAWATGADVYLESIDETYLNSLLTFESIFRNWFPQFSFATNIHVKNIQPNIFDNKGQALLFSSGVDSLASYIKNKDKKPSLISVWGADIPTIEFQFWNDVRQKLTNFASQENIKIHFIKTNARELINNELMGEEFGNIEGGWWETVSHGLILTGLTAILSDFRILLMASTFGNKYDEPHGSHIFKDINFGWADTRVIYDSPDLTRQSKISSILKNNPEYLSYLKVCHSQFREINCGICEKCLRTIIGLTLENLEPQNCNFKLKKEVFILTKAYFKHHLLDLEHNQILFG